MKTRRLPWRTYTQWVGACVTRAGVVTPPAFERDDLPVEACGERVVVSTEDDGRSSTRFLSEDGAETVDCRCVEPRGRLVEKQEPRRLNQRSGRATR